MAIKGITPVLNVSNVPASIVWFESLGWKRGFTWNEGGIIEGAAGRNAHSESHFGSVRAERAEVFLCRDGQGSRGTILPRWPGDDATDGVWMSWWIDSVQRLTNCTRRPCRSATP